jgi:predicted secreted protein
MNPVTAVVVFIMIWWLVLFMVLPWGVHRTENPGEGHDPGAPMRPLLVRKLLITTVIAAVLFAIFYGVAETGYISLRELGERYRL